MDQRVSGARVSSSTVEAFQALRTDAEVRFFEAQVGGISRLQLDATWPLEKYLDGAQIRCEGHPQGPQVALRASVAQLCV